MIRHQMDTIRGQTMAVIRIRTHTTISAVRLVRKSDRQQHTTNVVLLQELALL